MFQVNDDLSIYVTRGDAGVISITAKNKKGENHVFKAGDVVRFSVCEKKKCENIVLQKDFPIALDTETVIIDLTSQDTKIGETISKPRDYWYEVELNPLTFPQTIIAYDEDGTRIFKLFPECRDLTEDEPPITPEDIPIVDKALDLTSPRPVENRAVAKEIIRLQAAFDETKAKSDDTAAAVDFERTRIDNLIAHNVESFSQNLEYLSYVTDSTKSKIDGSIVSDGVFATLTVNLREANLFVGGSGMEVFIIPDECRPIDTGLIHTDDGLEYRIKYDTENRLYCLYMGAESDVTYAPSGAGSVTIVYKLGDYELKDVRVGADGTIYETAGDAVRAKTKVDLEIAEATKYAQPIIPFLDRLEIGYVQIETTGLTYKPYTNYVRTKKGVTIHLDVGDKITCLNDTRVYTGYYLNGTYQYNTWTSNFTATVAADYVLLFSKYDITDIGDLDSFLGNITITRANNYSAQIAELNKNTAHLLRLENTYQSKCTLYIGDATTTNAKRYSAKLDCPVYGAKISMPDTVRYAIQGYSDSDYTTKTYDSGWLTDEDYIIFDNPELYYVVIFIRLDDTNPTADDRNNTVVMQAVDLTAIVDQFKVYSSSSPLVYYDSSNDLIRSVAHRGLSDSAPENTAPAFVLAKQAGFTYVETDIQVTKDGKYVCVHDGTISKYTDGKNTGAVADYTLADLKAMDFGAWKGAKWIGTKILTFEEFILLCKKLGLKAYIELKYAHSEADVAYYLNYVKKMGMSENCVWRGATYNTYIRELSDTAVLAYDATSIMTEDRVKSIVKNYSPLFFHNDYSKVTEDIVELCHNCGVRIEVYTVNDEKTLDDLVSIGVDGITTDKFIAGNVFFQNLI